VVLNNIRSAGELRSTTIRGARHQFLSLETRKVRTRCSVLALESASLACCSWALHSRWDEPVRACYAAHTARQNADVRPQPALASSPIWAALSPPTRSYRPSTNPSPASLQRP